MRSHNPTGCLLLTAVLAFGSQGPCQDPPVTNEALDVKERAGAAWVAQDWPAAAAALRTLVEMDDQDGAAWYRLGYALHSAGRLDEALAAHLRATEFPEGRRLGSYNAACVYALKGETDQAFEWLSRSVEAGFVNSEHVAGDSDLDSLREDPRFGEFVAAMDNKAAARGAGQRNVAILVHEGVELLDFAGPGEVFSAARLPDEGGRAFNVYLVAESLEPIRSQGFVEITPNFTFETCPEPDLIVLPGGATGRPMNNPATMEWIEDSAPEAEVVLTVCTGALLLAKAGLLDGLAATTHHGSIAALRRMAPDTAVHEGLRYVDNGRIITTAGVSAGIDGALHLVSRLLGETAAVDAAWYMEYDWTPQEDAEEGVIVAGTSGSTAWVCPPCGEDCHDKTYDAPGTCENEACHMELVARRR